MFDDAPELASKLAGLGRREPAFALEDGRDAIAPSHAGSVTSATFWMASVSRSGCSIWVALTVALPRICATLCVKLMERSKKRRENSVERLLS
uniref:hypothetical protein n=1 Tax=Mesorhizobium atlanticum TaxID=2233532 RepID=UPI0037038139